jgi:hypothetical protein
MNSTPFNRFQNYLLGLASVATIIFVTGFSIKMLYSFFQFIETTIGASARQATEYLSDAY